ncbi:MAG: zinc ABC transporter substrate-binding protein [Anaerolineae bacterium]|nr:zinc ABC transporter substrate-binding protein [Anaerolineae bacterium]
MLLLAGAHLAPVGGLAQEGGDHLQVVASFSILADVARNVAGDAADVTALMPLNADPHSFVPAPRDLVALAEADVVLTVGASFEEGMAVSVANAGEDVNVVVASACVAILPFGDAAAHGDDAAHEEAAHEDDAAHADDSEIAALCATHKAELAALVGEAADAPQDAAPLGRLYTLDCGEAHEAGGCDPHVWTDPDNVMLWTMMVRDTLSALDPDHAAAYADNATAYLEALNALVNEEIAPAVSTIPEASRKLVTNHAALGYFAHRFGFEVVGLVIPGASTLAEPSAAEVAGLIDAIRAEGVPAVFAETTANPDLAWRIAEETGVPFYTLYTGSLGEPDGPAGTYLDYMRHNVRTFVAALGGTVQ